LARRIKFIGKKRGDRASGMRRFGRFGEAVVYLALLILGATALVIYIQNEILPEWRVSRHYEETVANVVETKTVEVTIDDATQFRPQILIEYQVKEESYSKWTYDYEQATYADKEDAEAVLAEFKVGQPHACWYDPDKPSNVVLVRHFNWLGLLLPISFILVGLGGLGYTWFYSGTSQERRAAFAKQVADAELFERDRGTSTGFPSVPADADQRNSPGTTLKYRLPIESTPGWRLFGAILAAVLWNSIVAIFVVMAVRSHMAGDPDWSLTLFMLPFFAIGVWLVYSTFRQVLFATGVGPTYVEVSDNPLKPGQEYDMILSQGGHLSIRQLDVHLICREKATFRQGTDTVTDTQVVCRLPVLSLKDVSIEAGVPYETRCQFRVPESAMHSFLGNNNAVNWKLSVHVQVDRWPDFRRDFAVVVCPEDAGGDSA